MAVRASRATSSLPEIDLEVCRAFWHARQGLASPSGPGLGVAVVVAKTGWVRTLGGAEAYLAVRARRPATTRAALDAAVAARMLQVVPAARGCIYLLPGDDVDAALALAQRLSQKKAERELLALKVKPAELDKLADQVLTVLEAGPATTDAIRRALPAGAARSLGEAGKKVGVSSPLPAALRRLEFARVIERTLDDGRLDTDRYRWRLAPTRRAARKLDDDQVDRMVVERFLASAGPVTAKELAEWMGVAQREGRIALSALGAAAVRVPGYADEAWVRAKDLDGLRKQAPAEPAPAFLPMEDNYLSWRGSLGLFTDAAQHARKVASWGSSKPVALGEAKHLAYRAVLVGDRLVGFWEADLARGEAVFELFAPVAAAMRRRLETAGRELVAFLRDELGHARTFSLDTDEAVAERAAGLRRSR